MQTRICRKIRVKYSNRIDFPKNGEVVGRQVGCAPKKTTDAIDALL
jgi:hypothetical protein